MSLRIYTDRDADLSVLRDEVLAMIGYGNQGKAWALCARDSGLNVVVGLRPEGRSWKVARSEGFDVVPIQEAAEKGTIICMLIPDLVQPEVYEAEIHTVLKPGKALCFAHGFNIHFKQIVPPKQIDVIMVAPKGPGVALREAFVQGKGIPALIAVHQDYSGKAREKALALAKAIGCTRAGVLETTFGDETESDLIGEQTVLVGGLTELIKKGFEVLVEAGYPPELAYFEACNEVKLIVDLINRQGLSGMLKAVSETAKYGGLTVGPAVIDEHVKERMRQAVKRVKSGEFARQWVSEYKRGAPELKRMLAEIEEHPLERVGKKLRRLAQA